MKKHIILSYVLFRILLNLRVGELGLLKDPNVNISALFTVLLK